MATPLPTPVEPAASRADKAEIAISRLAASKGKTTASRLARSDKNRGFMRIGYAETPLKFHYQKGEKSSFFVSPIP
jgi:hypothetical protein